nr:hypothetical protein [Tanacetum cinerariifolium]
SHATITYTSMSSYEVIGNGYFGMPMDQLDPYAQLVMEAPPLPHYIPGPEVPPSPDYIPGPKYPEYLPPADDVFPTEEQPLPAAVLPTAESPRYITDSEPKMDPEEDGDNEKSEGDSIDFPTSRGDNDADGDDDDLLEDDANDEDEEESLDSEEEEEEHLATTVPAPALHSSISASEDSDQTEPFEANPDPTTTATKPMTPEAINNLIAQHVTEALADTKHREIVLSTEIQAILLEQDPEHVSNCTMDNTVKFASCTLIGSALTWWNSHMRAVSQEVAYAMPWKTLRQMIITKYCPRGEIKKLEVELWNLKVKGMDITIYTLRFQELPEMIRGNVMSYEPKSMRKAIEFANDQMDQKVLGIADRQADNKRKFDNTSRNQQNQQPFKKNNNVARAYAAGSGEKKPYGGTKTLCPKCNFHHDGPCGSKCTHCKRTGRTTRDCRSRAANTNNNNNYNN